MVEFLTLLVTILQDPSGIPRDTPPRLESPKTPTGLPQDLPDLPDSPRTSRICLGRPPQDPLRTPQDPSGPLRDPPL